MILNTVYSKMLTELNSKKATDGTDNREDAVQKFCRSLALEGLGKSKEAIREREAAFVMQPLLELKVFRPPRLAY